MKKHITLLLLMIVRFFLDLVTLPFLLAQAIWEIATPIAKSIYKELASIPHIMKFYRDNKHAIDWDVPRELDLPRYDTYMDHIFDIYRSLASECPVPFWHFKTWRIAMRKSKTRLAQIAKFKQDYPQMLEYLVDGYQPSLGYLKKFHFDDYFERIDGNRVKLKDDLQTVIKAICLCPELADNTIYLPNQFDAYREVLLAMRLSLYSIYPNIPYRGWFIAEIQPHTQDQTGQPIPLTQQDDELYRLVCLERDTVNLYRDCRKDLAAGQLTAQAVRLAVKSFGQSMYIIYHSGTIPNLLQVKAFWHCMNNDSPYYRNNLRPYTQATENFLRAFDWQEKRGKLLDCLTDSLCVDDEEDEAPPVHKI